MQSVTDGIRLEVPIIIRIISLLICVIGYLVIFTLVPDRAFVLALVFWSLIQFRAILYAPEITVYEHGIETNRFGIRHFTHWREVEHFRKGKILSQVYPSGINKHVRRFLYSNLLINKWRRNYDTAIEMIEESLETIQSDMPERVYE